MVVVSSPSAVEECFTKNDIIFANRPLLLMGKHLGYNFTTLVNAPYGQHWRALRRVSLLELLSTTRLSTSAGIRRDEVKDMLGKVYDSSSVKVELKSVFRTLVYNILLRMLAGKRCGVMRTEEFSDVIREVLEFAGASNNPGDFVPVLRWVDYGGYMKRIKRLANKTDAFLQGLIEDHRKGMMISNNDTKDDEGSMISRLLSLQKSDPEYFTDDTIKGLILVSSLLFMSFILNLLVYNICQLPLLWLCTVLHELDQSFIIKNYIILNLNQLLNIHIR